MSLAGLASGASSSFAPPCLSALFLSGMTEAVFLTRKPDLLAHADAALAASLGHAVVVLALLQREALFGAEVGVGAVSNRHAADRVAGAIARVVARHRAHALARSARVEKPVLRGVGGRGLAARLFLLEEVAADLGAGPAGGAAANDGLRCGGRCRRRSCRGWRRVARVRCFRRRRGGNALRLVAGTAVLRASDRAGS